MAAAPTLVHDASVPLAWALPDEGRTAPARGVLASIADGTALVPTHWRAEGGNGLLMALRRGRLNPDRLPEILATLSTLPVAVDNAGAHDAWAEPLAQSLTTGLTLYDALYLELATARRLQLSTRPCDARRSYPESSFRHDEPFEHARSAGTKRYIQSASVTPTSAVR